VVREIHAPPNPASWQAAGRTVFQAQNDPYVNSLGNQRRMGMENEKLWTIGPYIFSFGLFG
jgi:hypothetical protein